ncbi:CGNR zinc finger domain-containing protein [Streptomyces griseus]|uniref:CGNR zinc finger domain-containing protein n=1 Tax=Streptomyces griseus TaxID=1911 RepID=UPI00365E49C6
MGSGATATSVSSVTACRVGPDRGTPQPRERWWWRSETCAPHSGPCWTPSSTVRSRLPWNRRRCAGLWCWRRERAVLLPVFPLRWEHGTDRLDGLRDVLALGAEELLGGDGLGRIRRCAGPGCGWFFVDRSRSGSRRWCSSRDCGNRDRARRHYARTRQRG